MTDNHRVVHVNGDKVRERLFDMGISERDFARRTRLGDATVRGMLHRNQLNSSAQLAEVYRALTELGLTPGQLLDPPPPIEPEDTTESDIHTLAGLLQSERTMHSKERLALALQWSLERLSETIKALDFHLQASGLRVHENSMGVTIRPLDERAEQARERLAHLHDDEDGINQNTARVMYAVYTGNMSMRETRNDHMVQLGRLKNRGAIEFGTGEGSRFTLSPDTAYAFAV